MAELVGPVLADQCCRHNPAAVAAGRPVAAGRLRGRARPAAAGSDGRRPADECRRPGSAAVAAWPGKLPDALPHRAGRVLAGRICCGGTRWLVSQAVAADWADKRVSGPFICRADFRLDEYDALFVELAQLQTDLSQALGVEPAREPVELYLFQPSTPIAPICRPGCRRSPTAGRCS